MKFFAILKKASKLRFCIGLFLVGLLFAVIAAYILVVPHEETIETEAVVQRTYSEETEDGEIREYAWVKYYVDGQEYEGQVGCSSFTKKNDTMTIAYNPSDPGNPMSAGGAWLPYLFFVIGAVAVGVSVLVAVKTVKTAAVNEFDQVDPSTVDPAVVEAIRNDVSPEAEYYFHWCGKMHQSYVLETPEREAVYRADCTKIGVAHPYEYDFTDCRTGKTRHCSVTHAVTERYGLGGGKFGNFSIPNSSSFKIDGENAWICLARNGFSIEPHLSGIKMNFDVLHYGVKVAYLEAAGVNILKDDATNPIGDKLPGTVLFKVRCRQNDIENVFMTCFTVSRVEFF